MIREAIILAGGLGTRLREVLPDTPKCMAPVAGLPFLSYVIRYLLSQGIERFVFSLGYKHELVEDFLKNHFSSLTYTCVIENQPLMTGGAIQFALSAAHDQHVVVVNGDTLFKADLHDMGALHLQQDAECTLALKPMRDFDRYGVVITDSDGRIIRFEEKMKYDQGNINGGVYLLNRDGFLFNAWPDVFSFEREYLEAYASQRRFFGLIQESYFIDIGIPEDYARAQSELAYKPIPFDRIDTSWTLFLDRDGVINVNKDKSYVFHPGEFIFCEGVLETLPKLNSIFDRIIVITNQRGVEKGLMTESDLQEVHAFMLRHIADAGGHIDSILYCTAMDDHHPDRKPNPGMAFRAKDRFPEIDFARAIMVGDKSSDVQWGRNIGAYTVRIAEPERLASDAETVADLTVSSLEAFCHFLLKE